MRRGVAIACLASLIATAIFGFVYWRARARTVDAARDRARGETARAAGVIDQELKRFEVVVNGVANDFTSGRVQKAAIVDRLRVAVDTTPQLAGIGAAFVPLAFDPQLRLHAPYVQRQGDAVEVVQLDSLYDYTLGGHEWYDVPLKNGASWSEPAVGESQRVLAVEYSVPFTMGPPATPPQPMGVIHGSMSLREINDLVSGLDVGEHGYSFLVSNKGYVISHPFAEEYAPARRAGATRGADAERMFDKIAAGGAVVDDVVDPVTGEPCWIFSERVPSTGWTVGVVFFKEESAQTRPLRRQQIRFVVALLVAACLALALILEPYRHVHDVHTLWVGSVMGAFLLAVGIAWLWMVAYGAKPESPSHDTVFVDTGSVRRFVLESTRRTLKNTGALPVLVPTGVFIQTLEILSPNNIAVTGYVWQKYAKNVPETIARGFVLPDAADRTITEAYRWSDAESETIGWHVKATIRQNFNYAKYPLDQQDFRLRIWHRDLDKNVVLVPDLGSYKILHPLARAGLEKDFVLPGWAIERTQFSSRVRNRPTTYGIGTAQEDTSSELSFDVVINRRIIEPVFSSLLPLAVCAFMVFSLLLIVKESTRPNVVQILSAFSGLFFVVILSELDLRRRVSGASILYIEYYYFVMYGTILCSALITLTNGWPGHFPRIEQREHFLPKLLFWPVILSTLAVITLVTFY